jgi:protein-S-isoprenylcysteine O-methyltransferase Ste14
MLDSTTLLLFLVLSGVAVIVSLHAWRTHQAYGFFRFFAFESLGLLIVWNARRWFREPFSMSQMISWIILAGSAALAVHGIHLLRVVGRARARVVEDTRTVVRVGAYRYIRHPLYASLMLFGWGVCFKGGDLASAALALLATVFLVATARYEERFNIDRFGAAYADYMRRTKMFIPFIL